MTHLTTHVRTGLLLAALAFLVSGDAPIAQSAATKLPDAVTADRRHYTLEFENDIVRVLRVRLPAGESAPAHAHAAYCAIELSDSSLREGTGPVAESKAGQVFCDLIPTAGEQVRIEGASHFLQEDRGERLAEEVIRHLG